MKKAYLYRLYPTDEQAALLQQQLDVAREAYNACLLERREAYRIRVLAQNNGLGSSPQAPTWPAGACVA